ncbi:NAD(P)H-hydrate dehydratase [Aquabacterium sp. J223]|nr:NAD(P)H-hydrate dehydratase [Aquabacterium sp. J223]
MQRAGAGLARLALAIAPHGRRVWVAAGPGNNGGDGLEAAAVLATAGRRVLVSLHGDPQRLPADAAESLRKAVAAGVDIVRAGQAPPPDEADLAIDALLGLGGRRPDGLIALGVAALRRLHRAGTTVLAVDLPTGLHADTGRRLGDEVVVADHTLSLLSLKPGLFTGAGRDHAGRVWLDRLQVDPALVPCDAWLAGRTRLQRLDGRRHEQHKGSFGDLQVIGGAAGMEGAAALAATAGLSAGAGRVHLVTLGDGTPPALRPELMRRTAAQALGPPLLAATTVVCGCGGGADVGALLPAVLADAARLVLDADALNAIAASPTLRGALAARRRPTVLTPHPLEAARLLGVTPFEVQADRLAAARRLAHETGAVVVLKGSGTVIDAPEAVPLINPTGGPRLAAPGTGDVLAGWLGGLWSAHGGDTVPQALALAAAAVQWHGLAAEDGGPAARLPLRAADLVEAMRGLGETGLGPAAPGRPGAG